jgi:hypothetical protein
LPRGVRKVESQLTDKDFNELKSTLPVYDKQSLIDSLQNSVELYRKLRVELFSSDIELQKDTEQKVMIVSMKS